MGLGTGSVAAERRGLAALALVSRLDREILTLGAPALVRDTRLDLALGRPARGAGGPALTAGGVRAGRRGRVRQVEEVLDLLHLGDRRGLTLDRLDHLGVLRLPADPDDAVRGVDVDLALGVAPAAEDHGLDLARQPDVVEV